MLRGGLGLFDEGGGENSTSLTTNTTTIAAQSSPTSTPPPRHLNAKRGALSKFYRPRWSSPPRVLLVDDDVVYRMLSGRLLQVFGCNIDTAADGLGAVDVLKMNLGKYDLVFMDIMMPKLDGITATSIIRQFDDMTPIISVTSNSMPAEIRTYYSSGMNDVLPKPFTRDGLYKILEKHLVHLKNIHELSATNTPRMPELPLPSHAAPTPPPSPLPLHQVAPEAPVASSSKVQGDADPVLSSPSPRLPFRCAASPCVSSDLPGTSRPPFPSPLSSLSSPLSVGKNDACSIPALPRSSPHTSSASSHSCDKLVRVSPSPTSSPPRIASPSLRPSSPPPPLSPSPEPPPFRLPRRHHQSLSLPPTRLPFFSGVPTPALSLDVTEAEEDDDYCLMDTEMVDASCILSSDTATLEMGPGLLGLPPPLSRDTSQLLLSRHGRKRRRDQVGDPGGCRPGDADRLCKRGKVG